jgi:hypothetical protein
LLGALIDVVIRKALDALSSTIIPLSAIVLCPVVFKPQKAKVQIKDNSSVIDRRLLNEVSVLKGLCYRFLNAGEE